MAPGYDKDYYEGKGSGNREDKGSDVVKRFDIHWWSNRFYASLCRRLLKRSGGSDFLEIGSAHGYILQAMSKDFNTSGIDISDYALAFCAKLSPESKVHKGDIEKDLPELFSAGSFDCILAKYVLEHLSDPAKVIGDCYGLLRKGGWLVISVPNTSSLMKERKGDDWIGIRDKTHVSVLDPDEWYSILKDDGFTVVRAFSDGFWDVPYVKRIPAILQLPFFAFFTIIETLLCIPFIPVKLGENLIVIARKDAE